MILKLHFHKCLSFISGADRLMKFFALFDLAKYIKCPIPPFFPSFSLPDVLCDPTDLIWRKGTPFEAMTGRRALSSDGLWGFPQL